MNNLFSFATKELSQDALLCWAINWMREAAKGTAYYELGKSLLNLFLGQHHLDEYENILILRQYKRIDVLIVFEGKGLRYGLIIEDKTHTSEHSNQIQRYQDTVTLDPELSIPAENLYVAYVKTGIIYDADRRVNANIVTLSQLQDTLLPYAERTGSHILSDYVAYLQTELAKRASVDKLIDDFDLTTPLVTSDYDNGKPVLGTYYGQYRMLDALFPDRNIEKQIDFGEGDRASQFHEYIDDIYAGTNKDGSPWTQYCFWGEKYPNHFTDTNRQECHFLFWRIDKYTPRKRNTDGSSKYYIALRHYDPQAHSLKFPEANKRKDNVYKQLRAVYDKLQAEYPNIIEPIGNRSIYKESDLVFIPVENLKKIGCGTFSEIQHFLLDITEFAKLAAQHLRYQ